jgi:hypothetical protein
MKIHFCLSVVFTTVFSASPALAWIPCKADTGLVLMAPSPEGCLRMLQGDQDHPPYPGTGEAALESWKQRHGQALEAKAKARAEERAVAESIARKKLVEDAVASYTSAVNDGASTASQRFKAAQAQFGTAIAWDAMWELQKSSGPAVESGGAR